MEYHTVYPNGFTPMGEDRLVQADLVEQLGWLPPSTFLLPLELWVLVGVLALLLVVILAIVVSRSRRMKVVKLVLAIFAALWTVGLSVGFLQFLASVQEWTVGIGVVLVGVSFVGAFGGLTGWLIRSALRKPAAQAHA